MHDIKIQLEDVLQKNGILDWQLEKQLDLALALFGEQHAEDKLGGILFLQHFLYDQFDYKYIIPKYESLFQKELIFDWNICDWFCIRVLGPTIKHNGMACAELIGKWSYEDYLWQARSSVVAFIYIAENREYHSLIKSSCVHLIHRPERFAKTAVGWMLREMSKIELEFVDRFLDEEIDYFSKESLRNATKYLDKSHQKVYLDRLAQVKG